MKEAALVLDAKASLGEGASWDAVKGVLYWVDIFSKAIHIYDPGRQTDRTIRTEQFVSAAVPGEGDELYLAMHHGFYALNLKNEKFTPIADPESALPNNRFNDGKCDARGRFWAGTMAIDESAGQGALYCLEKGLSAEEDYSVKKIFGHVSISNGMAWDTSNETMYYIDTPTKQVVAFDFDLESGVIRGKRVVITIPDGEGYPDGMNIDSEGMLWIAHWGGAMVSRWNPYTGEQLDTIHVPASKVTSCVFGGVDLEELYITTARDGLSAEELIDQPAAGGLFKANPGVRGTKTYRFGTVSQP